MNYRKDLDVLRAIAILLVILFHAQVPLFSGGFIGVDVFFVISGFLITNIIVSAIDDNNFSFKYFFERRLRRIYPALIILVLLVGVFCYLSGLYIEDIGGLRRSIRSAIFYYSNIYFYLKTGYFDSPAISQVFLHTWSLSVEMQFYIVYPFLVYFIYKRWKERISPIFILSIVLFFCISVLMVQYNPTAAFYMLPSRAWELLLGGYLAVTGLTPVSQKTKKMCIFLGLLMILASATIYNHIFYPSFPGIAALLPCIGAAAIISGFTGLSEKGKIIRFLLNPVFVFIGLISYSLYLWHWPILVIYKRIAATSEITWPWLLFLLALAFLVSAISWRYIENPVRRGLRGKSRKWQYLSLAIVLLVMGGSTELVRKKILLLPEQKSYAAGMDDRKDWQSGAVLGIHNGTPSFLLLGDSHAGAFATAFDELAYQNNLAGRLISSDGPLIHTFKRRSIEGFAISQDNLRSLIQKEKYETVYIIMRWSLGIHGYLPSEAATPEIETIGLEYNNGNVAYTGVEATRQGLRDTLDLLKANGAKKVYIMLPIPENSANIPLAASSLAFYNGDDVISRRLGVPLDVYYERNKVAISILEKISQEYNFVRLIDTKSVFYDKGTLSKAIENGKPLYFDDDHLSITGTRKFYPILAETMRKGKNDSSLKQ